MESTDKNQEIFSKIGELVSGEDFNAKVLEFIQANCGKFDNDVEENSHEHLQIHKDYVYISETLIELKLKDDYSFSEDEINHFYKTFEANQASYIETDSETVDILYNFIDFNKFKKHMLDFKNSTDYSEKECEELKTEEQK